MSRVQFDKVIIFGVSLIILLVAIEVSIYSMQLNPTRALRWPYNRPTSINFNVQDIKQAWDEWKAAQITAHNAGKADRLRVMGGVDDHSSVSEGQGYGLLFASIFDDQTTFDGLWLFTSDHLNAHGLMDWYIGHPGQRLGTGSATDADEDIALALVNACIKVQQEAWVPSPKGIDYCAAATRMINAIYQYEVDHPGDTPPAGLSNNPGNELLPGDQWQLSANYPRGIVNLSYFAPGYYTVFGKFTNNLAAWTAVIERNYQIVDLAQTKSGNCSGLVPNWNQYDGEPQEVAWQPDNYQWWSYDAARFAWRIALDRYWYDTANSRQIINKIGGFFSSVGIDQVGGEYNMSGQTSGGGPQPFFAANAASAIWAAPQPLPVDCGEATATLKTTPQQAYDAVLSTKDMPNSYYGNAWRLLALLLMSGNFPNFYEVAPSAGTLAATTPPTLPAKTTPTPGEASGCRVNYDISNDWDTGFTANVTLTNNTASNIDGWSLRWTFPGNQTITQMWNGDYNQNGPAIEVKHAHWNGNISPGSTTSFGFNASYGGSNTPPTSFVLNGMTCRLD